MKLRLDDNEKEQLLFLRGLGTGVHRITLDTLGFSEFWQIKFFIEETCALLKLHKFAEFKPFTFCKEKECFIEDIFLKTYHELILNGKEDEAKELAVKCSANVLNLVVEGKLTIDNFMEFHGTKINFFSGGHLDYDMIDFLVLQMLVEISKMTNGWIKYVAQNPTK
jgi:hypothetical protein